MTKLLHYFCHYFLHYPRHFLEFFLKIINLITHDIIIIIFQFHKFTPYLIPPIKKIWIIKIILIIRSIILHWIYIVLIQRCGSVVIISSSRLLGVSISDFYSHLYQRFWLLFSLIIPFLKFYSTLFLNIDFFASFFIFHFKSLFHSFLSLLIVFVLLP